MVDKESVVRVKLEIELTTDGSVSLRSAMQFLANLHENATRLTLDAPRGSKLTVSRPKMILDARGVGFNSDKVEFDSDIPGFEGKGEKVIE